MKTLIFLVFGFFFSRSYSQVSSNLHCMSLADSIIITDHGTITCTDISLADLNYNKSERYYKRFIYFIGGYDSLKYFDHFYLTRPSDGLVLGLRYRHNISYSIVASIEIYLTDTSELNFWHLKNFYKGKISFLGVNIDSNTRKNNLDGYEKLMEYQTLDKVDNNSPYKTKYIINNMTYIFRFNEEGQLLTLTLSDNGLN